MPHLFQRSTHAQRLERYLGADHLERISRAMRSGGGPAVKWYGRPIPLVVPGNVFVTGDGEFRGPIGAGQFANLAEHLLSIQRTRFRRRLRRWAGGQLATANAGFASLSDLIAEKSTGKGRSFLWKKDGSTGVAAATSTLWRVGAQPTGGSAGSAAPGGRAPTDDSPSGGAPIFTNPSGGDTQHLVRMDAQATTAGNSLMLYDRIFDVAKTMSSTANESVTGVPSRYQSVTQTDADHAGDNFLFIETFAALGATAHNWDNCTYTDQSGNTGATLPTVTGNASAIIDRLDQPVGTWFCPLATGDWGVKALTNMHCSASVTGSINFVIGHPLAICPLPTALQFFVLDGINTAFNLNRIFDDACLALLELLKPSTTSTTYNVWLQSVAG